MAARNPRSERRALARQAGKCPTPPFRLRPVNGRLERVQVASRCHSRRCKSCGVLWAGDTRARVLVNVTAYGGSVALVTITAPGQAVLPWDGTDERTVERVAARKWNRQARIERRKLHRKACQRAKRFAAKNGGDWSVIATSWEFQKRGVLHSHAVVPAATPLERMASQVYADALSEMAPRHGFGFVDRGRRAKSNGTWKRMLEVIPADRAARYVAKYVAKLGQGGVGLELGETVAHPDVPPQVVYVSRRLTGSTGVTMRSLRLRRRAFVLCKMVEPEVLDALDPDQSLTDEQLVAALSQVVP